MGAQSRWLVWINRRWTQLAAGKWLDVPSSLPHPRVARFRKPPIAEFAGQHADWVLPIDDGSRIHVHEMDDGSLIAHRDRIDPSISPAHALGHWLTESTSGRVTATVGVVSVGIWAFRKLLTSSAA